MKKLKIYLFLAIGFLLVSGCQKDEIMTFDISDAGVVFPGAGDGATYKGYNSSDKTYYINESFLNVPLGQQNYVVDIPVRVSGVDVNNDRFVNYRLIAEETTAKESQYEISEAKIPAGEQYGYIRFILTRDEALDTMSVNVALELIDSEDLKVGSIEYKKAVLNWSNMLPMFPLSGYYSRTYNMILLSPLSKLSTSISYYSQNGHKAILDALGWPIDYWPRYSNSYEDPGTGSTTLMGAYYTDLYARKLQEYLDQYAEQNGGERLKHNAGVAKGVAIQARVNGAVYNPNL